MEAWEGRVDSFRKDFLAAVVIQLRDQHGERWRVHLDDLILESLDAECAHDE